MVNDYYLSVLLVVILSYFLGSIPTAYLIAKFHKVNIFEIGSGNMGATNVVRAVGLRWGIAVLILDVFKGIAAIYFSRHIMPETSKAAATTISAIVVIIGHNWSLFATLFTGTLRGGKGAATAFGTLLMIAPIQVILSMLFLGGLIVAATRYVSLAVLATFLVAVLWMSVLTLQQQIEAWVMVYMAFMSVLIVLRFRENIQRLLAGTERRFGDRT